MPRTEPAPRSGASLDDWLRWQEQLHPRAIELGLERVRAVAAALGLLAPRALTLTVAGTNGKGSAATLLASIYRAAGYRVGLYTSPHLIRYNERIAIDGRPVDDQAICAAFAAIDAARGRHTLTYFEFGTLAALQLFADAQVDVQVLEVGLGGRLDAVNILDADAALLTSIGIDHTDWLGPDREAIGTEKAGVFRSRRPAICADPDPPSSVLAHARAIDASLQCIGVDFDFEDCGAGWHWRGRTSRYPALPRPGLPGVVQLRNAAGVLAVVEAMQARLPVAETAIRAALPALRLPGRGEPHGDVILDVAHNVEAVEVLVERLRAAGLQGRVRLVIAMLADKPVEAVAERLAPVAVASYCAALPPPRGLDGPGFAARARVLAPVVCASLAAAYDAARAALQPGERIVVCGSFLTVAEVAGRLNE